MKNLPALIISGILLTPIAGFAAGLHYDGAVNIVGNLMVANMSVRHNTAAAGSPYVYITGDAGGAVIFYGIDSEGESLSCVVSTTNALHSKAEDVKNNFSNGSRILVRKSPTSNECDWLNFGNFSFYLD